MSQNTKYSIVALRLALGWLFLYAGVTKILNPEWSAAGYLKVAKTFPGLYRWLASSQNIGWVNFLNEWGLTLIGIALILGILVKIASYSGIFMMALYYLPILQFPKVGDHSLIVDEHIIYIIAFLLIASTASEKPFSLRVEKVK